MAKLAIMSDLHVDINQLGPAELQQLSAVLLAQKITRLHLAGDTANDVALLLETVGQLEASGIAVTFNFGNHELPSLKTPFEMEDFADPRFLNQRSLRLNEEKILVGVNGWYDYSFAAEGNAEKHLAAKNLYWYDRLIERGASDPAVMAAIIARLEELLTALAGTSKEIIVATHFVPRAEFIVHHTGRYERWNQLNAFLGSRQMGELLARFPQVTHVVFGHTHRKFAAELNGVKFSAQPLGYFYEWQLTKDFMLSRQLMTQFNPGKVRGLLKDHQADFAAYRKVHLAAEFARSLTVIDY